MSFSGEIIINDLAHLPVWVGWREEQRNGKATKVPYSPRTGWEAKSNDAETWATRGEAETWAIANRGGVGIVLSQLNGGDCSLCGIDLDTCRDPAAETFQDWAQEVIDRFSTYTEVSPSGTGAKLFFTHASADLQAIERLFGGLGGRQFKNGGGEHCPAIEIYRTGRYFAVTDESIGPTDILRQVPIDDIEWLVLDAGPRFAHKESQKSGSSSNDQSRSGKAFRKGAALKAAGYSYDAMRDALLADEDVEIADWARTKGLANGEREMHRVFGNANGKASGKRKITLSPYVWRDPSSIPRRQWLYGKHYIRKFISATFAPGGLGKTSQVLVEAIAMATGRPLLGVPVPQRLRAAYWNGEDPADETERRIAAILLHFKIPREEIEGWLFVDSGRDLPICIATLSSAGIILTPDAEALTDELIERQIDVFILDPFVKTHAVPENDNGAIDRVARTFAGIADAANCSIELTHHVRKAAGNGRAEVTADDGRGAGSLKDAGRCVRVLNIMTADEAASASVKPKECKRYFRIDDNVGKANMMPPADAADWFKLVSVPLYNDDDPTAPGDSIGVVISWTMPGVFAGITAGDLPRVQTKIDSGVWARSVQADDWAGYAIAEVLNIDVSDEVAKVRVKKLLAAWIESGALKVRSQPGPKTHGRNRPEIVVGYWIEGAAPDET